MDTNEWTPAMALETSGSYWAASTLHSAIELDLFTILGDRQYDIEEIVRIINADERGLSMLLNALSALKLISKTGRKYFNTPFSKSFLSKDSRQYIGYIIMHHKHLTDVWVKLSRAVRSGLPVKDREFLNDKEQLENFLMGMFNVASNVAPKVAEKIDLSNCNHLLDIGGGPGTYAIHFCMKYLQLKASIYDLPPTRPFAEKTILEFNLTDRIRFVEGNYLLDKIEGSYDVVWLSHILHAEGPESCRTILQKAVSVMEPGGIILVHDFILNDTMDGPVFPALFSLNMLLNTPSGRSYSEKQIMDMLSSAGVRELRRVPFQGFNDSGIISGMV
ncbi:hypothetical protein BuS5_02819 [Desulfosarcina sp. BuS5]|uniref:methyltransferase n=1 Tax=Desulfosarcina sp. BuS5 TaxID=933262 RepID=UPI000484F7A9|nr:methyltransferase [Desulfosarcina sp. BuS5]WDN89851.1 hypothetical protein BuS5_02819 [Desulfosarcina sp. BuS5]